MIGLSWRGGFTQPGIVLVVLVATRDVAAGAELAFDDAAPHPAAVTTIMPSKM